VSGDYDRRESTTLASSLARASIGMPLNKHLEHEDGALVFDRGAGGDGDGEKPDGGCDAVG
jgi:hypothetical protein